jgi:predicted nucleic acid-binding protein
VIVADSGPLIAFALLRQLDLLRTLYKSVLVPPAVWAEVTDNSERPGAVEVRDADWLERVPAVRTADALLLAELGLGEAEAIYLSIERGGAELLVDERKARRIARVVYNLPVR